MKQAPQRVPSGGENKPQHITTRKGVEPVYSPAELAESAAECQAQRDYNGAGGYLLELELLIPNESERRGLLREAGYLFSRSQPQRVVSGA